MVEKEKPIEMEHTRINKSKMVSWSEPTKLYKYIAQVMSYCNTSKFAPIMLPIICCTLLLAWLLDMNDRHNGNRVQLSLYHRVRELS